MKHKTNQILFAYWNEVRAGRMAPRRFEIEPARIAPILAETFILERSQPGIYRYRLAGTRICEQFGQELRGADFIESWAPADQEGIEIDLSHITTQGGVGRLEFTASTEDGDGVAFEAILLPLVHTNETVDRLLGAMAAIDPPNWIGSRRLGERCLTNREVLWPDGRPHALIERSDRQSPFLPAVRHARLVRSERRQFRVYDGGLAGTTDDKG